MNERIVSELDEIRHLKPHEKEGPMASKSPVNEATRHLIWAYGAGVVTGLALFGAGSFYIGMLTR